MTKTELCGGILNFWWPSWIDNGYFLTLYSINGKHHLNQLVILRSISFRGDKLKEKKAYTKIWALPVKNCSFEFLPLTC